MSEVGILISTVAALAVIVVLIVNLKVNPVVALIIGALGLGLVCGLGIDGAVESVTSGFGEIMAEIGLLIVFGVLIGSILKQLGAIERLVGSLMKAFGKRLMPFATALAIGTGLQSIYLDVLLVITAPLARTIAPRLGRLGQAKMATALAIGLECGIVLMVPGVGTLALSGLLGVPLSTMLVYGLITIVPTIIVSLVIMFWVYNRGWWDPSKDEMSPLAEPATSEESVESATADAHDHISDLPGDEAAAAGGSTSVAVKQKQQTRQAPLLLLFAPVTLAILLIASGSLTKITDFSSPVLTFLSTPTIALLIALIGTALVGIVYLPKGAVSRSISQGFQESGQILILTAVGGSLAGTINAVGVGDILKQYLVGNTIAPLLLVWAFAAVLHVAIGSVSISAITAAGMIAPFAPSLGIDPVFIALAAGAGSLFLVHVTSNTFWLLQSLMRLTTRGALKAVSVGVSVASVIGLGVVVAWSAIL